MSTRGSKKPIGSGRARGTPNRSVLPLLQKSQELGVDPFEVLLHFAGGNWKALGYPAPCQASDPIAEERIGGSFITTDQRLKAAAEACQYLYPKRKAVESIETKNADEDRPLRHLTDEELDAL